MNDNPKTGTRTLCSIFSNMRDLMKTLNFSYLPGLIEEAQYRAERMENSLETYSDSYYGLEAMEKRRVELKEEIKQLKIKKDLLLGV